MGAEKVILFGSAPCENWDFLAPLREEKPDVICADGGIQLALQAGFTPTAYVGDGDSGYAQSQDIAEGTKVKRGSVIRISFVSSGGVEAAGNTSTNSEE